MLINQQQRDELELALSCTDHEYRLPVKHKHLKPTTQHPVLAVRKRKKF